MIVETERLLLRRFEPRDFEPLARFYTDDQVMRHMLPGRGLSRSEAQDRAKSNIHNFNDHWERRGYGVWAVQDRASKRLLGQCGLRWVAEAEQTELLYLLGKTYWGAGYAMEVGRAWLQWFDTHFPGEPLFADVHAEHARSQRVLAKLGFGYTGDGPIWERVVSWFSLSRETWTAMQTESVPGNITA